MTNYLVIVTVISSILTIIWLVLILAVSKLIKCCLIMPLISAGHEFFDYEIYIVYRLFIQE